MLRLYLTILLCSTIVLPSTGQSTRKVRATYLATLNLSGDPGSTERKQGELLMEEHLSLFRYLPPPVDSSAGYSHPEVGTDELGTPTVAVRFSSQDSINKRYYIDRQKELLISREFVFDRGKGTPYIVREDLQRISWVLINEFKEIGNFRCQKATGRFRGRIYTVWFSPQVPVNGGPWKLHGLPGLILEAYDIDRAVHFICKSLEFPYQGNLPINSPIEGKHVTLQEYIEEREKTVTNFKNYLLSKLPRGASIEINSVRNLELEQEFDFRKQ